MVRNSVRAWLESGAGEVNAYRRRFGHAMDAAGDHRGGKMMRTDDQVADNLCIRGIRHRGFKRTPTTVAERSPGCC